MSLSTLLWIEGRARAVQMCRVTIRNCLRVPSSKKFVEGKGSQKYLTASLDGIIRWNAEGFLRLVQMSVNTKEIIIPSVGGVLINLVYKSFFLVCILKNDGFQKRCNVYRK